MYLFVVLQLYILCLREYQTLLEKSVRFPNIRWLYLRTVRSMLL